MGEAAIAAKELEEAAAADDDEDEAAAVGALSIGAAWPRPSAFAFTRCDSCNRILARSSNIICCCINCRSASKFLSMSVCSETCCVSSSTSAARLAAMRFAHSCCLSVTAVMRSLSCLGSPTHRMSL